MSITTATNLSVSNSATILGNTILGTDNTSTLIVNSISTYNNGLVVINDIIHESGVYYGTSDATYFNGDITINNNATFTSSTGKTTINSVLSEFYGNIAIIKNENGDNKLYLTNLTYENFVSLCHNGTGYLDFTDNFYIRGSGGITEIINIEDNKISFKCETTFYSNVYFECTLVTFKCNIFVKDEKRLYFINDAGTNYLEIYNNMTNSYASYYHTYAHLFKCGTSQEILKLSTTDINLYKDITVASGKKLVMNGDLYIYDDNKFILGNSSGNEFFSLNHDSYFNKIYASATYPLYITSTNDIDFYSLSGTINMLQDVKIKTLTTSTSITTGSLVVSGGVGISGPIYCSGINCSGDIITSSNLTCNALNCSDIFISSDINETIYRKFRGYSDYDPDNPAFTFYYTKYDGSIYNGTSSSASLTINDSCRCVKVTYECDINEALENQSMTCGLYVYKRRMYSNATIWTQFEAWHVGTNSVYPIECVITSANILTIQFPKSTNLNDAQRFYWSYSIEIL